MPLGPLFATLRPEDFFNASSPRVSLRPLNTSSRFVGAAYLACQDQGTSTGTPSVGWLWSYPGSGNTAARLLIDAASGFTTGSVYSDGSLAEALAGEMKDATNPTVANKMTFIKTHTFGTYEVLPAANPYELADPSDWPHVHQTAMIVREPYAAMLAEHVRQMTGSHTGILDRIDDYTAWEDKTQFMADHWQRTVEAQLKCTEGSPAEFCTKHNLVKLEDLLGADDRSEVLRTLVAFAGVRVDDKRLRCAFEHAETYHRHGSISVNEAFCAPSFSEAGRERLRNILDDTAKRVGYAPLDCGATASNAAAMRREFVTSSEDASWALP